MAILYPHLDTITKLKQAPTEGELHALNILSNLSDEYEIFFQPFINGNNPDIIVLRKNFGVLIIEVKDWNLKSYTIENNNWELKKDKIQIKSPIDQVKAYKDNLYNLSIPSLLHSKIKDTKSYGIVQTLVYFHNEAVISKEINTDNFCPVLGNNHFNIEYLSKGYSIRKYPNKLFTNEIYEEFKRILKPSFHTLEQAQEVKLSKKQKLLSKSENKHQKISGFAGSGKTLVLAQRAVNSHIRHGDKVLILTFNITLINYIHDNLNRVREKFDWNNFHIIHYDAFIISQANDHNIKNVKNDDLELFKNVSDQIIKYKAIFIDEIQDYKEEWIKIIKKYFLEEDGEFVVFGDEKQNIYDTKLDSDKKPNTTIPRRWNKLDQSFRLSDKILHLSEDFQSEFFSDKYELDKAIPQQIEIAFDNSTIEYTMFNEEDSLSSLSNLIINSVHKNKIQPQNVCVLSHTNQLLRELDFEIRETTGQKTYTTFETQEMYDYLKKIYTDERMLKSEIRKIQRNKRFNFWMNAGGMKLSTIHSFKGWEIDTLFLIIDNKSDFETSELLYTALTRCRNKLFILNIDNEKYDKFFSERATQSTSAHEIMSAIEQPKSSNQKPLGKVVEEDIAFNKVSKITSGFSQLRGNNRFNMLILGEISENKDIFKSSLNNHFEKYGIRAQEWQLDFWSNKDIKNKDLRSLKKGQSKYNLLITGQIHKHSSKGNKNANLLTELMKPQYVKRIYGTPPQKRLTTDIFVNKVDQYISNIAARH